MYRPKGTAHRDHKGRYIINDTHDPLPWRGEGCCCCKRPLFGDGTQDNPIRHYETLAELAQMYRASVLRMRVQYPNAKHPYQLAFMGYLLEQTGIDVNA